MKDTAEYQKFDGDADNLEKRDCGLASARVAIHLDNVRKSIIDYWGL